MPNYRYKDQDHDEQFAEALKREAQVVGRIMSGYYKVIKGELIKK